MLLHPVTSRAWQVHWTMLRKRSYFVWQFTLTPSNIFLFFTEFGQQCPWIWGIRLIEAISWHFQAGQVMDALPSAHPVSDWLMCPSRPGNYFVLLWAKITEKTQIVFFPSVTLFLRWYTMAICRQCRGIMQYYMCECRKSIWWILHQFETASSCYWRKETFFGLSRFASELSGSEVVFLL